VARAPSSPPCQAPWQSEVARRERTLINQSSHTVNHVSLTVNDHCRAASGRVPHTAEGGDEWGICRRVWGWIRHRARNVIKSLMA